MVVAQEKPEGHIYRVLGITPKPLEESIKVSAKGPLMSFSATSSESRLPMTFFIDHKEGKPIGRLIRTFDVTHSGGKTLSEYIMVKRKPETCIYNLTTAAITELDERECEMALVAAGGVAEYSISRRDFGKVVEILEGISIPAMEQLSLTTGRRIKPYREQAPGLLEAAAAAGLTGEKLPRRVMDVINQPTINEAIHKANSLDPLETNTLFVLCALRMKQQIQGPDIMRLASHLTKKIIGYPA